jgi:hypothetical protein
MNIFIHLVLMLIFIYALLLLNIPGIEYDNYLSRKLYLFFGVFLFEVIIVIILRAYKKCTINMTLIVKNALIVALIAVVGYSIYNDLLLMQSPLILNQTSPNIRYLAVSSLIVFLVAICYFIEMLFTSSSTDNDCIANANL